jgi:hypothetical protein
MIRRKSHSRLPGHKGVTSNRPPLVGKRKQQRAPNRGTRPLVDATKPSPWKIPPCACGVTKFALVGSDGGMYFAVQCESCRKEYVFRVRGRKLTMLRQID